MRCHTVDLTATMSGIATQSRRSFTVARKKNRSNIPNSTQIRLEADERARQRRRTLLLRTGLAVVACAAVATASLFLRHSHNVQPNKPVSTVDANARACVLADPNDPALTTIDAGLQQAATANGHLNIQHYSIPSTDTDARPILNGLIADRCEVVVGAGPQADQAIEAYAADGQSPAAKLIIVGAAATGDANISILSPAGLTASAVATLVENDS